MESVVVIEEWNFWFHIPFLCCDEQLFLYEK